MRLRVLSVLLALLVLPLAACGSGGDSSDKGGSSGPVVKGHGDLVGLQVQDGTTPKLSVTKKPFSVKKTAVQQVKPGTGPKITKGENVKVDYVLVNGRSGSQADSTFGKQQVVFAADPQLVLPGIATGLINQRVGSRVMVAIPPADAFGPQGNQQLGVQGTDTLVFLMDLRQARAPMPQAKGTPVAPKAGLPTVKVDAKGNPTITVPKTAAPKNLIVQPLIKGTGAKVKSGQTIAAHYTGVLWRNGKVFDSTTKTGKFADFVIGAQQVIPGWDKGLVGQTIGSRILMVVPPADGYGSSGSSDGSIKATDTLVFVIDILDAM